MTPSIIWKNLPKGGLKNPRKDLLHFNKNENIISYYFMLETSGNTYQVLEVSIHYIRNIKISWKK